MLCWLISWIEVWFLPLHTRLDLAIFTNYIIVSFYLKVMLIGIIEKWCRNLEKPFSTYPKKWEYVLKILVQSILKTFQILPCFRSLTSKHSWWNFGCLNWKSSNGKSTDVETMQLWERISHTFIVPAQNVLTFYSCSPFLSALFKEMPLISYPFRFSRRSQ